ncbi:hypothetical protein KC980_04100, partial [candidate division WWE3 bacterium]|nr:hypothetical protein [candidate division WWE3 bacterium]
MNNASINKLTIRATHILSAFVDVDTISSSEFLTLIKKSEGMGTALMHHLSPLNTKDSIVLKINDVVVEAFNQASIFEHSYVGTEHLLLAVLKLTSSKDHSRAKSSLVKLSLFPSLGSKTSVPGIGAIMSMFGKVLSTGIFVDSLPYYQKPISDSYIALLQKEHSNLALLGGTSASNDLFANYLASSINRFECPLLLSGYTVVSFDLFSFFALATSRSMSIGVMLDGLLSELKALNRVILYIKDFNNLVVSTPTGYTVPIYFTLFMRAIKDTNIKVLIPAEQDIFDRLMSDSPESLDAFTSIKLSQPKETDIYSILKLLRRDYSEYHNVKIPLSVLRYLSKKVLEKDDFTDVMASSLDLLDTACSMVGSTSNVFSDKYKDLIKHSHGVLRDIVKSLDTGDFEHAQVGKAKLSRSDKALTKVEDEMFEKEAMTLQNLDIDKALTQLGIKDPSNNIRSINANKLSSLSRRLKSNVIGQNAAVDAVSKAIIRSTLGLKKG